MSRKRSLDCRNSPAQQREHTFSGSAHKFPRGSFLAAHGEYDSLMRLLTRVGRYGVSFLNRISGERLTTGDQAIASREEANPCLSNP